MPPGADIAHNLDTVRRRIDAAAQRAGRLATDITLVAVSKTFPAEDIREAAAAGIESFGENRVQEALPKIDAVADLGLQWHLIGHLQSNKARRAATAFGWIQSVDSVDLVHRLNRAAEDAGCRPRVLIQVDLAKEATKHGADTHAVPSVVDAALAAESLDLRGLMVVPPYTDSPEDSREWFVQLRVLRDGLVRGGAPTERLRELSMGMSHDFDVAIEEGATIVRVGTAIFGRRSHAPA
jgi:pyridoxal phosphate enzyme (YggS family)